MKFSRGSSRRDRRGLGLLAVVPGLAALLVVPSPAGASHTASDVSGTGGTQTNVHQRNVLGQQTGGNGGDREGCVRYDSSRFDLTFTAGTVSNGTGSFNASPDKPIIATVVVGDVGSTVGTAAYADDRYEGPHGTYNPNVGGTVPEVVTTAGGGCKVHFTAPGPTPALPYNGTGGDTPVVAPITLSMTRLGLGGVAICSTTNPTSGSPAPDIARGVDDFDGQGSTALLSALVRPVADADLRYTIRGVKCGTATYTLTAHLDPPPVPGGACVAPVAPAECVIMSASMKRVS